jgi:hypothetical protein
VTIRPNDRRVFMGPVEPRAGQEPGRAPVQPGMHPVAVEFDFVQPVRSFRRLVDEFGELRFHPTGERQRFRERPSRERSDHINTGHDRMRRTYPPPGAGEDLLTGRKLDLRRYRVLRQLLIRSRIRLALKQANSDS